MSRITMNTNLASLNSQRHLGNATQKLQQNYSRLSSGMRINRASDDAAGLSVSSLLNADRAILNQGIRNLNDGVSYLNIAEGAINEMTNIMFRIKEIAEQSANGTLSNDQRKPLQDEVTALQKEYNRILRSTEFNDIKLLTGENTRMELQAGYGISGSLATQIGKTLASDAFGVLAAGETSRISTSSSGGEGNFASNQPTLTGDGKFAVFQSNANNLISGVSGSQIYIKNLETQELSLVSSTLDGTRGDGASSQASVSKDGNFVAFRSTSTNLIDGISGDQIYLKNLQTGEISLVSESTSGDAGNNSSFDTSISGDGKFTVFWSRSTNFASGVTGDQVYLKNNETGELTHISQNEDGTAANGGNYFPRISDDGKTLTFWSSANNLISGASGFQVYSKNIETGELKLASSTQDGTFGDDDSTNPNISADGNFISFTSLSTNLVSGVSGQQIYVKNLQTDEITLASSTSSGQEGNGDSNLSTLSADGRYVAFRSDSTNLIEGVSGMQVYRKDLHTGEIELVSRSTDGLSGTLDSDRPSMTYDGQLLAFQSNATELIEDDTNGQIDIFLRDLSKTGVNEISGLIVSNQTSSRITLDMTNEIFNDLSLVKANIGASASRIDSAISNLNSTTLNLANASSQITDTDVAEETAKLAVNQITQQSATSILAQANLQTDLVLGLLRNI